mmetsp:Transcript_42361/g.90117  ORF Transcript_42361/g.90117 Transcript_42361/m.90117 type:complete len:212 (-) Transcript_42361:2485-3120(-)
MFLSAFFSFFWRSFRIATADFLSSSAFLPSDFLPLPPHFWPFWSAAAVFSVLTSSVTSSKTPTRPMLRFVFFCHFSYSSPNFTLSLFTSCPLSNLIFLLLESPLSSSPTVVWTYFRLLLSHLIMRWRFTRSTFSSPTISSMFSSIRWASALDPFELLEADGCIAASIWRLRAAAAVSRVASLSMKWRSSRKSAPRLLLAFLEIASLLEPGL